MNGAAHSYRDFLRREFANRCGHNPRYSLRAFARDLHFLPSRLSDVLNGKQGLSARTASQIAKRLALSGPEKEWFAASVESEHARSELRRAQAKLKLETLQDGDRYRHLREDVFAVVADWYHFALLELVHTKDFRPESDWIARKLGIAPVVASAAIDRLLSVGLLKREGSQLVATSSFVASPDEIPSEATRRHHRQIMEKAVEALAFQPVSKREFSTNTLAFDPSDLPAVKEDLKRFRRRLERKYQKSANRTEVYCLAQQFFSLTPELPKEKHS